MLAVLAEKWKLITAKASSMEAPQRSYKKKAGIYGRKYSGQTTDKSSTEIDYDYDIMRHRDALCTHVNQFLFTLGIVEVVIKISSFTNTEPMMSL